MRVKNNIEYPAKLGLFIIYTLAQYYLLPILHSSRLGYAHPFLSQRHPHPHLTLCSQPKRDLSFFIFIVICSGSSLLGYPLGRPLPLGDDRSGALCECSVSLVSRAHPPFSPSSHYLGLLLVRIALLLLPTLFAHPSVDLILPPLWTANKIQNTIKTSTTYTMREEECAYQPRKYHRDFRARQ